MLNDNVRKPTALFWVVAVIFVLWNVIGCSIYVVEMTMSDAAYADAFGAELAEVRDVYPTWGLTGYALAVWGGLLAAVLFILRRRLSPTLFIFSLIMAIIGFIPTFTNATLKSAAGDRFWVMPLIVVVMGLIEVIFSRKQQANGILR